MFISMLVLLKENIDALVQNALRGIVSRISILDPDHERTAGIDLFRPSSQQFLN
jgi:hypothetical protein